MYFDQLCSARLIFFEIIGIYSQQIIILITFKMILRLIAGFTLLQLILTDATTETHIDFGQTVAQCNLPLLQRVERLVKINYSFNLMGGDTWQQFPDFNIIIDLPFAQYVKVKYNICYHLSSIYHMGARLRVDGNLNDEYAALASYDWTPCLFRYGEMYLEAGKHQFIVEYRTPAPTENSQWDWNRNFFKVEYFRKVASS